MVDLFAPKTNPASSLNLKIKSSICKSPLYSSEDFLIQKYVAEKMSARQISVLIGCAHSTINDALDKFGITKSKRHRGGHIPYGWKLKFCRIVHHTREQNIIQQMAKWKARGWSNKRIAARLSNRGIRSPSGDSPWSAATVGRILWRLRYRNPDRPK